MLYYNPLKTKNCTLQCSRRPAVHPCRHRPACRPVLHSDCGVPSPQLRSLRHCCVMKLRYVESRKVGAVTSMRPASAHVGTLCQQPPFRPRQAPLQAANSASVQPAQANNQWVGVSN